jgi:uncharacterized protein (TIGR02246 family)
MRSIFVAFLIAIPAVSQARPQPGTAEPAVQALVDQMVTAWNRHDAAAYAKFFTSDCDFIPPTGQTWKGSSEVQEKLTALYQGPLKESKFSMSIDSVRTPSPDVKLLNGTAVDDTGLTGSDGKKLAPGRGAYTLVVTKSGDDWRVASFQITLIQQPSTPQAER